MLVLLRAYYCCCYFCFYFLDLLNANLFPEGNGGVDHEPRGRSSWLACECAKRDPCQSHVTASFSLYLPPSLFTSTVSFSSTAGGIVCNLAEHKKIHTSSILCFLRRFQSKTNTAHQHKHTNSCEYCLSLIHI